MNAAGRCTDPPEASCSDAGCPEHGEPDGQHYCEDYELCGTCLLCTGCCRLWPCTGCYSCTADDHADRLPQ